MVVPWSAIGYCWGVIKALLPFLNKPEYLKYIAYVRFREPQHGDDVFSDEFSVTGDYWILCGMKLAIFYVDGDKYFLQARVQTNSTHKSWRETVQIRVPRPGLHTFVVAAISDDICFALKYHGEVHLETEQWIPLTICAHDCPPGYVELDRIDVKYKSLPKFDS